MNQAKIVWHQTGVRWSGGETARMRRNAAALAALDVRMALYGVAAIGGTLVGGVVGAFTSGGLA